MLYLSTVVAGKDIVKYLLQGRMDLVKAVIKGLKN